MPINIFHLSKHQEKINQNENAPDLDDAAHAHQGFSTNLTIPLEIVINSKTHRPWMTSHTLIKAFRPIKDFPFSRKKPNRNTCRPWMTSHTPIKIFDQSKHSLRFIFHQYKYVPILDDVTHSNRSFSGHQSSPAKNDETNRKKCRPWVTSHTPIKAFRPIRAILSIETMTNKPVK